MRITIFGSGYVGLVTGACLADAGNHVVCVDVDERKTAMLQQGQMPIHEPGLDAGTFGGGVPSPTMDRLAAEGLRYNTFHTTALCSPTRAALITGRNHHSVATGVIGETATGYDGYRDRLTDPSSCNCQGPASGWGEVPLLAGLLEANSCMVSRIYLCGCTGVSWMRTS